MFVLFLQNGDGWITTSDLTKRKFRDFGTNNRKEAAVKKSHVTDVWKELLHHGLIEIRPRTQSKKESYALKKALEFRLKRTPMNLHRIHLFMSLYDELGVGYHAGRYILPGNLQREKLEIYVNGGKPEQDSPSSYAMSMKKIEDDLKEYVTLFENKSRLQIAKTTIPERLQYIHDSAFESLHRSKEEIDFSYHNRHKRKERAWINWQLRDTEKSLLKFRKDPAYQDVVPLAEHLIQHLKSRIQEIEGKEQITKKAVLLLDEREASSGNDSLAV